MQEALYSILVYDVAACQLLSMSARDRESAVETERETERTKEDSSEQYLPRYCLVRLHERDSELDQGLSVAPL